MRASPRSGRRLRGTLGLVLVLAVGGCSPGHRPDPHVPDALGDWEPGTLGTWGLHPTSREVFALGASPMRVLRPVTLESVELEMEHGEMEPLEYRVSLFACPTCPPRPGLVGYAGYAGTVCSFGPWPPSGYGPSYPVRGFTLFPGDRPSLLLYARRRSPRAESRAFVVTYREGSERHVVRITSDRLKIEPARSAGGDGCAESVWFGGTNNPEVKLIKTMTPTAAPATPIAP